MPNHVYKPANVKLTFWDRLMVHPMDIPAAIIAIIFAVMVTASIIIPGFTPSKSMDQMPTLVTFLIAGALGNGGLLALVGLNWSGKHASHGWALERFGWLLAWLGFWTYGFTVYTHYPESIFAWAIPVALGVGSALRWWSVILIERSMKAFAARDKE